MAYFKRLCRSCQKRLFGLLNMFIYTWRDEQEKLLDEETRKKNSTFCTVWYWMTTSWRPASFVKGKLCRVFSNDEKTTMLQVEGWWSGKNSHLENLCQTMDVELKTCQKCVSSLIVWGLPLFASLLYPSSLSSCPSSSAFGKLRSAERMVHKLLYKNGRMAKGLLKPLGHHNTYPIHHIDFPFCWQISQPCQRKKGFAMPLGDDHRNNFKRAHILPHTHSDMPHLGPK